jgi:hypothetical protein
MVEDLLRGLTVQRQGLVDTSFVDDLYAHPTPEHLYFARAQSLTLCSVFHHRITGATTCSPLPRGIRCVLVQLMRTNLKLLFYDLPPGACRVVTPNTVRQPWPRGHLRRLARHQHPACSVRFRGSNPANLIDNSPLRLGHLPQRPRNAKLQQSASTAGPCAPHLLGRSHL